MSKFKWIFYRFTQSISIFNMTSKATNSRIKDMGQAMLSKKDVTDYSCAFSIAIITPYSSEICYCIYMLFLLDHICKKLLRRYSIDYTNVCYYISILLHKTDYCFSEVFWDVFCLVFYFLWWFLNFYSDRRYLSTIIILWNSTLICDDPWSLVEMMMSKLW